jgi:hypothetical protein
MKSSQVSNFFCNFPAIDSVREIFLLDNRGGARKHPSRILSWIKELFITAKGYGISQNRIV